MTQCFEAAQCLVYIRYVTDISQYVYSLILQSCIYQLHAVSRFQVLQCPADGETIYRHCTEDKMTVCHTKKIQMTESSA